MFTLRKAVKSILIWLSIRRRYLSRYRHVQECVKINLGCGLDLKSGYINVDANGKYKPDIVGDVITALKGFPDSSINEILALHIMSYLSQSELLALLNQSLRVLQSNGSLIIEGPDLEKMIKNLNFENYDPSMVYPLYASSFTGPTHQNPYINAIVFNWLAEELRRIGFSQVLLQSPQTHNQNSNRDTRITAIK